VRRAHCVRENVRRCEILSQEGDRCRRPRVPPRPRRGSGHRAGPPGAMRHLRPRSLVGRPSTGAGRQRLDLRRLRPGLQRRGARSLALQAIRRRPAGLVALLQATRAGVRAAWAWCRRARSCTHSTRTQACQQPLEDLLAAQPAEPLEGGPAVGLVTAPNAGGPEVVDGPATAHLACRQLTDASGAPLRMRATLPVANEPSSKQLVSSLRDNTRVKRMRLFSPTLDFWVDAAVVHREGRWLAITTICDELEIGTGYSLYEALWRALQPLGNDACKSLLRDASIRRP
jgi:hypothetical protein